MLQQHIIGLPGSKHSLQVASSKHELVVDGNASLSSVNLKHSPTCLIQCVVKVTVRHAIHSVHYIWLVWQFPGLRINVHCTFRIMHCQPYTQSNVHSTTRLKPRLHQDTCCRIQVVSTCCHQHVSCIGNKIVVSLSPVCCWIQGIQKSTMTQTNSSYVAEIQSTCIPNEQLVSGNVCPSTYMYPDKSSSGTRVSGRNDCVIV